MARDPASFDARWRDPFVFAVTRLGLSPSAFWALTPREWRWLAREAGPAALNRRDLAALAARFPDRPAMKDDQHDR
ncbi:MAG: phage tail assembly chaperone [Pseudomonadota bacterium]